MYWIEYKAADEDASIRLHVKSRKKEIEKQAKKLFGRNLVLTLVNQTSIRLLLHTQEPAQEAAFYREIGALYDTREMNRTGLYKNEENGSIFWGVLVDIEPYPLAPEVGNTAHFELVNPDEISPFLSERGGDRAMEFEDPVVKRVLSAYRDGGLEGEQFKQTKSVFLGNTEALDYYLILPEPFLEDLSMGMWYELLLGEGGEFEGALIHAPDPMGDYQEILVSGGGSLIDDDALQARLSELYSIEEIPEKMEDHEVQLQAGIQADTQFYCAAVYDVGQALCVGLADENGSLAGFFDFGMPYVGRTPLVGRAPGLPMIAGFLAELAPRVHIPVLLSHWHMDHCILAKALPWELHHTRWIAPTNGIGPAAQQIRTIIQNNGGTLQTIAGSASSLWLNGNQNLQYGKVNLPADYPHPHHHCLYLRMALKSGNTVFLAGDATYYGIININRTNNGRGYTYLQASHHGGNYSLPPIHRQPTDIPLTDGQAQDVIFSAGAYTTHHHPSAQSIADYAAQGWVNPYNTHMSGAVDLV